MVGGLVGHRGPARGWQRAGTVAAAFLCVLANGSPAAAQRLHGRLLDVDTNQPIPAGLLTLRTSEGERLVTVVADAQGQWLLDLPRPGRYYVEATRIGYQPWVAGPLELKAGDDLDSVFHLRRRPIQLAPIEVSVEARRRYLELAGFYERQRSDFGHFVEPEDIERRSARRITDLLLGLPGVNLVPTTGGDVGARSIQLRGSSLSQGGVCRPRVFVDGLIYARGDARPRRRDDRITIEQRADEQLERIDEGISLDDIGPPSSIIGIEVYRSASQVPVRFGGTSVETLCGVIVLWTRMGSGRDPR